MEQHGEQDEDGHHEVGRVDRGQRHFVRDVGGRGQRRVGEVVQPQVQQDGPYRRGHVTRVHDGGNPDPSTRACNQMARVSRGGGGGERLRRDEHVVFKNDGLATHWC